MNYNLKISVIIPTCDRPHYLREAIASVLKQSYLPKEVIVVDNGVEQESVSDFSGNIPIRVLRLPPRSGVSKARNEGAKIAIGDCYAFLDDDDWWCSRFLERLAKKMIETGAVCVYGRKDIYSNGEIKSYKTLRLEELIPPVLLVRNPGVGGINFLITKEAFYSVGGFDSDLPASEDRALALELLLKGATFAIEHEAVAVVRTHNGTRLRSSPKRKVKFLVKYRGLYNRKQYFFMWFKLIYMEFRRWCKL